MPATRSIVSCPFTFMICPAASRSWCFWVEEGNSGKKCHGSKTHDHGQPEVLVEVPHQIPGSLPVWNGARPMQSMRLSAWKGTAYRCVRIYQVVCALEHDPLKWKPLLRQDHRQVIDLARVLSEQVIPPGRNARYWFCKLSKALTGFAVARKAGTRGQKL